MLSDGLSGSANLHNEQQAVIFIVADFGDWW